GLCVKQCDRDAGYWWSDLLFRFRAPLAISSLSYYTRPGARLPHCPAPVAIRTSSAKEIDGLIADLGSDRAMTRETAIARLAVIGARAVERLVALVDQPDRRPVSRVAALRALEGLGDTRALEPALRAAASGDADIAAAGVAVLKTFVRGRHS